jgi:hypothetical protein
MFSEVHLEKLLTVELSKIILVLMTIWHHQKHLDLSFFALFPDFCKWVYGKYLIGESMTLGLLFFIK